MRGLLYYLIVYLAWRLSGSPRYDREREEWQK